MSSAFRLSAVACVASLFFSACSCGDVAPSELVSPTNSLVEADATAPADGATLAEVTVTVLDHDGNPLSGIDVSIATSRGAADLVNQPQAATDGGGVAVGHVASTESGTTVVTATAAGVALEATAEILFEAGCPEGEVDCGEAGCQVLGTDDHCAACGDACASPANAIGLCDGGTCDFVCDDGFASCDDDPSTGCETELDESGECPPCPGGQVLCDAVCVDLGTVDHCTDCDDACETTLANTAPVCDEDGCGWVCETGWGSCDDDPSTGCETELDGDGQCPDESCPEGTVDCDAAGCVVLGSLDHCTGCFDACAEPDDGSAVCTASGCGIACDGGYEECPSAPGECTALDTVSNCGQCGEACTAPANAIPLCELGDCTFVCEAGYGFCEATGTCIVLGTPENCAACGDVCEAPANAVGVCEDGVCDYACEEGYGNCDLDDATGCEEALDGDGHCASGCPPGEADCGAGCEPVDTVDDCGACGNACETPPNAVAVCERYQCGYVCEDGWGDCDGDAGTGCEQALDVQDHCGDCGVECTDPPQAVGFCDGAESPASCSYVCDTGFADCNFDPADGCETDLGDGTCCDDGSFLTVTETCLTAEAGAELIVHVELLDALGGGVTGADVVIDGGGLVAVGDVVESASRPGVYWQRMAAPDAVGTFDVTATADAGACGAPVSFEAVEVEVRTPVAHAAGGTGGCSPRGGNLRVRAVDDTGAPIEGAFVMVGQSASSTAFHADYDAWLAGGSPDAPNHGLTDDEGYLTFRDHGTALADGTRLITAGAEGHAYMSLAAFDVADVVLVLEPIPVLADRIDLSGTAEPDFTNDGNGRVAMALATPTLDVSALARFQLTDVLEANKPLTATGDFCAQAQMEVPANVYVPDQREIGCDIEADPSEWVLGLMPGGDVDLVGLQGDISIIEAFNNQDSIPSLISAIQFRQVGLRTAVATGADQSDIEIDLTAPLSTTMPVTADNAPLGELYIMSVGDLDGENGTGRLFLQGVKVAEDATTLSDTLTTADPQGPFADTNHFAMALSVVYGEGAIGVLDRANDDRTTARVLDDFFSTPSASASFRTYAWQDVANANSPAAPHVSRSIFRRITPTDAPWRNEEEPFWVVYTPGDVRTFTLPSTLPPTAPRYLNGGWLTPSGDQSNRWFLGVYYLGVAEGTPTFDVDDFAFSSVEARLTHLSISERQVF